LSPASVDKDVTSLLKAAGIALDASLGDLPDAASRARQGPRGKRGAGKVKSAIIVELSDSDGESSHNDEIGSATRATQSGAIDLDSDGDEALPASRVAKKRASAAPRPTSSTATAGTAPAQVQLQLQSSAADATALCDGCGALLSQASGLTVPGLSGSSAAGSGR